MFQIYTNEAETPPEFPRARSRPQASDHGRDRWSSPVTMDEAVRKQTMDQEKKRELEANRRSKQRRGTSGALSTNVL